MAELKSVTRCPLHPRLNSIIKSTSHATIIHSGVDRCEVKREDSRFMVRQSYRVTAADVWERFPSTISIAEDT